MIELLILDLVLDLILYFLFAGDEFVVLFIIGGFAGGSLGIIVARDNEEEKLFNGLEQGGE